MNAETASAIQAVASVINLLFVVFVFWRERSDDRKGQKMEKKEFRRQMDDLGVKIARLQRECKELKIPVVIVFEGFGDIEELDIVEAYKMVEVPR